MFTFKLELEDGTPADPPTFTAAVPNWKAGDTIPLGPATLRVVEVREGVLVVATPLGGVGDMWVSRGPPCFSDAVAVEHPHHEADDE